MRSFLDEKTIASLSTTFEVTTVYPGGEETKENKSILSREICLRVNENYLEFLQDRDYILLDTIITDVCNEQLELIVYNPSAILPLQKVLNRLKRETDTVIGQISVTRRQLASEKVTQNLELWGMNKSLLANQINVVEYIRGSIVNCKGNLNWKYVALTGGAIFLVVFVGGMYFGPPAAIASLIGEGAGANFLFSSVFAGIWGLLGYATLDWSKFFANLELSTQQKNNIKMQAQLKRINPGDNVDLADNNVQYEDEKESNKESKKIVNAEEPEEMKKISVKETKYDDHFPMSQSSLTLLPKKSELIKGKDNNSEDSKKTGNFSFALLGA